MKMKILVSFLLIICCISACSSSPVSISDGIFASEASIGRNLLQAKKSCPVNFEYMNYTIITSRCKGPQYPAKLCCDAFKDFACPYRDELNDLSNDCASTMFSYINLYGKYPPGLFSNLCRDDKVGLICPALAPGAIRNTVGSDSNNSPNIHSLSILTLTMGFITFLFMWV
ncbi:GPI-anchored protein LLG1-like [Bidens hawaiensis]|uniref:GPI-anchored protein LLG1-like n=1 Tax=Bidens hawaiensis TaxID=980011 RepID=UPI004049321A